MTQFPKGFIWGTATSSYQIEGAAHEDGRADSIWDVFCKKPGAVANGDTGDLACDHYHRVDEDISLLVDLGVDAYRFSCAWPRIMPQGTGLVNANGLDFYSRLVDKLLEKNIEPWLTLYHWDLPQTLQEKGGWTNREIVNWFEDYALAVVNRLGDRVSKFMILNEPSVTSYQGHLEGSHAPGIQNRVSYAASVHHQNLVIGNTYSLLKDINPALTVGSAYTHFPVRPVSATRENEAAARLMDAVWTRVFFDPLFKGQYPEILAGDFTSLVQQGDMEKIKKSLDFIGIQHYAPSYAQQMSEAIIGAGFVSPPAGTEVTAMGWAVDPEAFNETLMDLKKNYGNPVVVITENGAAYDDVLDHGTVKDDRRVKHYEDYLVQVEKALSDGCDIRGYFAWSFLDNFEWAWGYDKRFGLVYVDYDTLARIPKNSYNWYMDCIKNNGFSENEVCLKKCL